MSDSTPFEARKKPVRILLVEDQPENRAIMARLLAGPDLEIIAVHQGEEAVQRASKGGIDVILMDLELPGIDGYEAARRIRDRAHSEGFLPAPIIALTGYGGPEIEEACQTAGMQAVLTKPADRADLRAAITALLKARPLALVVDDQPSDRLILARQADFIGLASLVASSGEEALLRAQASPPLAIALLDYEMPEMTGEDTLAALRLRQPELPALAVTAHTDPLIHERLRTSGFNDVLPKPITVSELRSAVRRLLGLPVSADQSSDLRRSTTPTPTPLVNIPPTTPEDLKVQVDPLVLDLVPIFLDRVHQRLQSLRGTQPCPTEGFRRLGHNLKGTAAGYGFSHMGLLGAHLEQASKNGSEPEIKALARAIDHYLSEVEWSPEAEAALHDLPRGG